MLEKYILLSLFWLFFCVLHSVLADIKIKFILHKTFLFRLIPYRITYNVWAFVSLAAVLIYQFSFDSPALFQRNLLVIITGALIAAAGLFIMIICIKKYFLQLSGLQDSYNDNLQVTGIHTKIRHPLYSGTFLFIIGLWILMPTWSNLLSVSIIIVYTLIGIILEEKKLVLHFGDQYIQYKKNVPALIPKIFTA